jgi:putative MATE family efflux protein
MTAAAPPAGAADLTTGRLSTAILRVAVPAVGAALLQLVFLLIDTFWVGRILGPAALAAVSTAGFAVWMLIAVGEMIGVGLTAVAARRHGEGAHGLAAVAAGTTLALGLLGGVAVAIVGWLGLPWLFAIMGTPPDVTEMGRLYLSTYLIGTPFIFGYFATEATFRASGDTRTPLMLLAGSIVVNLVLDPLLILGVGPLPALGISGAAIAAIATRGLTVLFGLVFLVRRRLVRLAVWHWRSALAVVRVGAPTAATGIIFSLVYIGLTRVTTRFGTPALAALGVGHKLEGFAYMAATGFALAAAAVVGQNLGAARPDRARRAGWITTGYALAAGSLAAIAFLAFPEILVSVFTSSPEVIADGASYLRIIAVAEIAMAVEIVLEGAMGGAGFTLQPMLWSVCLTAARIPLGAWLAGAYGLVGIWWAISLTGVGRGVAMAMLWSGERWQSVKV